MKRSPRQLALAAFISLGAIPSLVSAQQVDDASNNDQSIVDRPMLSEMFAAPVPIESSAGRLNQENEILYPSPAIFDVDRDGQQELVLGDIFGGITVFENQAGEGEPVWDDGTPLEADGQTIRLPNW